MEKWVEEETVNYRSCTIQCRMDTGTPYLS